VKQTYTHLLQTIPDHHIMVICLAITLAKWKVKHG